ncbi:trypsin-like peptidase domain-containing protein [Anaerophilus nitritogenes]|uniref:trypsin-like peptidase domain-containing protein n=1 Tax=Anaerophilus nitritogenes TaxID=2498136 RepID=UPI00101C65A0|nr:trypsin-like peptidase domain-containing protein [Anaerophilus nitritogenes]
MIITVKPLKFTMLETKNPFEDMRCIFKDKRNANGVRTTLFCRYIGMNEMEDVYIKELKELDHYLQSHALHYIKFIHGLEKIIDINGIEKMKKVMEDYMNLENKYLSSSELFYFHMGYEIENESLEWTKKIAFQETLKLYDHHNPYGNPTMRKNFGVKLLLWMNRYIRKLFKNKIDRQLIPKVIFYGDITRHEFYFLIFLWKLGCDVLYLNPKEDITHEADKYSKLFTCRNMRNCSVPFEENMIKQKNNSLMNTKKQVNIEHQSNIIEAKEYAEKSYEELARLAESVVMVHVYDKNEKIISRGSGVVINCEGWIVTNFHVVSKGLFFGVVFENDPNEYRAYNIVKYHTDYDLALIKVDKKTKPIPLYEKELVRGQKIITIGSPLGLFNTISNGIVSGFRELDQIKMLQITAPISPGSSGGALIDMYGNLVGITSAGFEGQNLNLAVPSVYVKKFIGK